MTTIVPIIGPLLLIALFGFGSARYGVLDRQQVLWLGRFLVTAALPAVLLVSLSKLRIDAIFGGPFMLAYLAVGGALGVGTAFISRQFLNANAAEATTLLLAVAIPNNIIIGFPLAQQLLGAESLPLFVAAVTIENIVLLPLALTLFEFSAHKGHVSFTVLAGVARRVIANPITLSVLTGICLSIMDMTLPALVLSSLQLLGGAVSGMALFYVGALLAEGRVGRLSSKVALAVTSRLLIAPLVALAVGLFMFDLTAFERACLILFCAPPCFSVLPAIAAPYGAQQLGASIQVLGTGLSALTLPVVMALLV